MYFLWRHQEMIKIVTLIDLHIVLTYDCWHCFLVFNIWVTHALEMITIIFITQPLSCFAFHLPNLLLTQNFVYQPFSLDLSLIYFLRWLLWLAIVLQSLGQTRKHFLERFACGNTIMCRWNTTSTYNSYGMFKKSKKVFTLVFWSKIFLPKVWRTFEEIWTFPDFLPWHFGFTSERTLLGESWTFF
jgi:hypothetical protein